MLQFETTYHESSEDEDLNLREAVVNAALNLVGSTAKRYEGPEFGCSRESGFDCSGFVCYVLSEAGLEIPNGIRHTNEFFDRYGVLIHPTAVEPGDLVFFSWSGEFPQHMGIVSQDGYYIHAHTKSGLVKRSPILFRPVPHPAPKSIYIYNPIGFKRISLPRGRYHGVT